MFTVPETVANSISDSHTSRHNSNRKRKSNSSSKSNNTQQQHQQQQHQKNSKMYKQSVCYSNSNSNSNTTQQGIIKYTWYSLMSVCGEVRSRPSLSTIIVSAAYCKRCGRLPEALKLMYCLTTHAQSTPSI